MKNCRSARWFATTTVVRATMWFRLMTFGSFRIAAFVTQVEPSCDNSAAIGRFGRIARFNHRKTAADNGIHHRGLSAELKMALAVALS